jgi:curved DNA-binding protein CbpA
MARDFYAILAVAKTATEDQIRQRFRQLARERHPDRFEGEEKLAAELEFQEITQAFNALTDPERRRQHDMDLSSRRQEVPSDPKQVGRVYLQRGVKAYRERNLAEAADNFDRAVRADPASSQAWYNLALVYSQGPAAATGGSPGPTSLSRAAAAIERACELEPMNAGYWRHAGRILAMMGRGEAAAAAYRKAIDWGEDDPAIHQALEELTKAPRRGLFGKPN